VRWFRKTAISHPADTSFPIWARRDGCASPFATLGAGAGLVLLGLPDTWALVGILTVVLSEFIGMLWTPVRTSSRRPPTGSPSTRAGPAASQIQWSAGGAIGSAAGGAFSQGVGDLVTYLVAAAVCLLSAGFWWLRQPAATCS
jgi:predicted MFS family arabinose efflux permease